MAKERAEQSNSKRRTTSPEILGRSDDDNNIVIIPDTPPRPDEESQGDTTITVCPLAIRISLEHLRVIAPAPFNREDKLPPSTAPPDLQPQGRERVKSGKIRANEEAQEEGYELDSQPQK